MTHLDQTRLIEAIYLQDSSLSETAHLASCETCKARFDALKAGLEADAGRLRDTVDSRPESFWSRQRLSIVRRVASEAEPRRDRTARRYAIAAIISLAVLAGSLLYRAFIDSYSSAPETHRASTSSESPVPDVRAEATADVALFEETTTADPWASEELEDFRQVVSWESWIEGTDLEPGGTS